MIVSRELIKEVLFFCPCLFPISHVSNLRAKTYSTGVPQVGFAMRVLRRWHGQTSSGKSGFVFGQLLVTDGLDWQLAPTQVVSLR